MWRKYLWRKYLWRKYPVWTGLWMTLAVLGALALGLAAAPAAAEAPLNAPQPGTASGNYLWLQANHDGFGSKQTNAVESLVEYQGQLYTGAVDLSGTGARRLMRSPDGFSFSEVIGADFGRANNFGISSLAPFGGQLYAGTDNFNWRTNRSEGGEIWRSPDGVHWDVVASGGFGDPDQKSIEALQVFQNTLYAATVNAVGKHGAEIWRSSTGNAGDWTRVVSNGLGHPWATSVRDLEVYDGDLYAAVTNYASGAEVWRSADGLNWERVMTNGNGNAAMPSAASLAVFGNRLYVYLSGEEGALIVRCHACDGADWLPVTLPGMGDAENAEIGVLVSWEGRLYAGLGNEQSGLQVWSSLNGLHWQRLTLSGFGDRANDAFHSHCAAPFHNMLFWGTRNDATGGELWLFDDAAFIVNRISLSGQT